MGISIIFTTILYSQDYDKTPISIEEIKKGIINVDYLRSILLEKGFKFERKDSVMESWRVPVNYGDENIKSLFSQILLQTYTSKFKGIAFEKSIYIRIRKDLLPKYLEVFHTLVTTYFSEKKAIPITVSRGNGPKKDDFQLVYYRQDSKIEVEYDEDYPYVMYNFRLNVYKKQ
jgi:hypothetical protein